MPQQLDKSTLAYLGEPYQYKLVKQFMEDKTCFKDLAPIIDQNMFTGQYLRMFVGTMLEYLHKHNCVPSYSSMAIELRQKAHTQADIEICEGIIERIRKDTPSDGAEQTIDLATRFFKQQNIAKAANEMLRLVSTGDLDNYDRCEQLLRDALNTGAHQEYEEARLYDGLDETLSQDFRITIPTGIKKLDDLLNGGIGKGELGAIVCPSSIGKTSMTTSLAGTAATYRCEMNMNSGYKVLQIVFEDRIKQIQRKHFSRITQIEACDLSKDENIDEVRKVLDEFEEKDLINENLSIIRLPSGEKTIEYIINVIKKHIDIGFRPDLVIIDYFECIKLTGPSNMTKWDKETATMRRIEAAANELNIAIWVPIQGNKESMKTELVTMDNGGGSIGKIQIAHIIVTITKSKEDRDHNLATIRIDKNRAGSTGDFRVIFNNGTSTISSEGVEEVDGVEDFYNSADFVQNNFDRISDLSSSMFKNKVKHLG